MVCSSVRAWLEQNNARVCTSGVFKLKYCLGHPGNYLFALFIKKKSGFKHSKHILFYFEKESTGVYATL